MAITVFCYSNCAIDMIREYYQHKPDNHGHAIHCMAILLDYVWDFDVYHSDVV